MIPNQMQQIEANRMVAAEAPAIGEKSFIQANEVVLGRNVRIGSHVDIVCDRLELGDGCSIGAHSSLMSPEITLEDGCSVGKSAEAELNDFLRLGRQSSLGHRVKVSGRGLSSGEFLWMKNDVIVGGGGSQGPNSYLRIGNQSTIIDKCYLNLSEEISMGDGVALSYNVTILTHGAWQPALMGFKTKFGRVRIGNYSVVYLNAIVLPGLSIGDYATVGAGAVVMRDVPDYSLAMGNPATIVKSAPNYPSPLAERDIDSLLLSILSDYSRTLELKGGKVVETSSLDHCFLEVDLNGGRYTIAYVRRGGGPRPRPGITIAFGPLSEASAGECHFNLKDLTVDGKSTALSEDLRDYLRRRAIRVFTDKPFRAIPLANLSRLRSRKAARKTV
jgi:acetyltransferase-like isoleucine patch superfamily enzyme